MKYEVWVAYWFNGEYIEEINKIFDDKKLAKNWIRQRECVCRTLGETRVYWIEECF
jgi:hypothetical protein